MSGGGCVGRAGVMEISSPTHCKRRHPALLKAMLINRLAHGGNYTLRPEPTATISRLGPGQSALYIAATGE